ncbi:MAG TPA: hypothetical protein VMU17_06720, partial [Elusimicrobiota bacterium]|nr:hypothetical protein [Elusimicrobiota bacterium]
MKRAIVGIALALGCVAGNLRAEGTAAAPGDYVVVPSTVARVTDAFYRPDERFPQFILIQDVHEHPEVQSDIATIIVEAYRSWGVRKVF